MQRRAFKGKKPGEKSQDRIRYRRGEEEGDERTGQLSLI